MPYRYWSRTSVLCNCRVKSALGSGSVWRGLDFERLSLRRLPSVNHLHHVRDLPKLVADASGHSRSFVAQWRESASRPLEEHLNDMMVGVARQFEVLRVRREQREAERKRQREAEQRRYELEQQRKRESIRFRRLVQQAEDRRTAAEIRALVEAVRARQAGASSEDAAKFERWSSWALAHANRIDPLLGTEVFDLRVSDDEVYQFEDEDRPSFDRHRRTQFWGGSRGA